MSIQNDKLMNLQDGQVLYNDLRDRIEDTKLNATLSTPTPVASFSDGAPYPMSMQFAIEPMQDLHGYSSPWPGGGGKNLLDATAAAGTYGGITFTLIENPSMHLSGTYSSPVYRYFTDAIVLKPSTKYTISGVVPSCRIRIREYDSSNNLLATTECYETTTITINSQTDHADVYAIIFGLDATANFYPMIEEGETASTFSPYSNICPISGFDGANVTVTGKNLLDVQDYTETKNGVTVSIKDGVLKINGKYTNSANWLNIPIGNINVKENILFSCGVNHSWNGNGYSLQVKNNSSYRATATGVLIPAGEYEIVLSIAYDKQIDATLYPMVRLANVTDTTFEPYSGTVYSITFPTEAGTVYGGTVTVNPDGTGELVVDRGIHQVVANNVGRNSKYNLYYYDIPEQFRKSQTPTCNMLKGYAPMSAASLSAYSNAVALYASLGGINMALPVSTLEEAKTFITNNPINVLFELVTPITYTLTPGQVLSLLGQNNVWADTGDIQSLSYVRNTVPKLIRQDMAGQIASALLNTKDFSAETSSDTNLVPYIFRQTGDIGDKDGLKDKLIGGTVAWNQQLKSEINNINSTTSSKYGAVHTNRSSVTVNDNTNEFTFTSLQNTGTSGIYFNKPNAGAPLHDNHVYMQSCYVKAPKSFNFIIGTYGNQKRFNSLTSNTYVYVSCIVNFASTDNEFVFNFNASNSWDGTETVYIKNIQLIDVTQVFGSTIANALYAMETASAGSGVAWFRNLFPDDYYAYNAGELMSVKTSGHRTTGFNLWDEEWERGIIDAETGMNDNNAIRGCRSKNFIPVRPETVYYFKNTTGKNSRMRYYDKQKNYLGIYDYNGYSTVAAPGGMVKTPSNCYWFRFATQDDITSISNICINLSKETGSPKNGDYVPYEMIRLYPLDPIDLRGLPVLTNGVLSYDGDTYEPDGTVTRKYGIVDLGILTWEKGTAQSNTFFGSNVISDIKKPRSNSVVATWVIDPKGWARHDSDHTYSAVKSLAVRSAGSIVIVDSNYDSGDAAAFKAAMSGVYLVYELATPTTESAEPFDAAQKVDPNGTLEYIDERSVPIPVGHDGVYGHYLRMKGEDAPTRDTVKELIAPVQEELTDTESSIAIVIEGNVAPTGGLASGKYIYLKSHNTLARGLYHTTVAIAAGASITSSNVSTDDEGVANLFVPQDVVATAGSAIRNLNAFVIKKIAGIIYGSGYIVLNKTLEKQDLLFTLPADGRPTITVNYMLFTYSQDSSISFLASVGSSGLVKVTDLPANFSCDSGQYWSGTFIAI